MTERQTRAKRLVRIRRMKANQMFEAHSEFNVNRMKANQMFEAHLKNMFLVEI
jgi:hypothetical protein